MKAILLFIPFFLFAQNPTIDWYRIHFPPSLIYTYNDKVNDNSGYSDKARTKVIENLKSYNHSEISTSVKKIMRLAEKDKKRTICFAGLNKNKKREEFLLFSQPHLLSFANQIIVRKDNDKIKEFVNKKGEISLSLLLDSNFKVSVATGRAYSHKIDRILENYKSIVKTASKDISHSYLKQVISKRVDFTIDYPVNINYFKSKGIIDNNTSLASYPISEESDKIKVYFGCSKNSKYSKDIIEKIDKIIKNNNKEMTKYYTDYLSQEQKSIY